ncbi:3232_t:CDS:1, partial [Funneliformis geosporum]
YIYSSDIDVEKFNEAQIVDVLGAADELCLSVLVEVLQEELLDRKHIWMNKQSVLIYNAGQKFPTCTKLAETMEEALYQEPELLLKSDDFTSLEEDTIIWLLQRDDLGMGELELWKRIVQWGIGQLPTKTIIPDVARWPDEDCVKLEKVLRPLIPFIRWCNMSPVDFERQVHSYKRILPTTLHKPGIKGKSLYLITKEYTRGHARIQSVLIKPHHAAKIASWIDRLDSSDNQIPYYTPSNIPYYFKLVARGSRDQPFLQQTLNDNRAVVLIKPANSNEILGGYNPLTWSKKSISSNSNKDQQSNKDDIPLKNSFIFNLRKDPDDKEDILSRVINPIDSIYCNVYCSPVFGKGDLFPKGHFEIGQPCGCKQTSYEKSLRASTDQFPIEEFEVFQIIKKTVL